MSAAFLCRTCGKQLDIFKAKNLFEDDNVILQKIETLTGLWLTNDKSTPGNICGPCLLDLDRAVEFRQRCIKINDILLEGTKKKIEDEQFDSAEIDTKFTNNLPYKIVLTKNSVRRKSKFSKQTISKYLDEDRLDNFNLDSDHFLPESSAKEKSATIFDVLSDALSDDRKRNLPSLKNIQKSGSYFCDQCGRRFNDKANLNRHLQRHLGVKKFECPDCGHKDYSQHLINLHKRIQHQGEKPYACKYCGNRFANSMKRLRHQRTHVEFLDPKVKIPIFTCTVCEKTFTKKSTLDKHSVVHTGEQPFCCEICDVYFNRKSSLQTHYRSKAHINKATFKFDELENSN